MARALSARCQQAEVDEADLTSLAGAPSPTGNSTLQAGIPGPKPQLTVRFDRDLIEWFKAQGAGYQTRMNAVLRSYVAAQTSHPPPPRR
ncbi:MAG: BrnA antitoxin family protein [Chloroflexia bacterium]|nr:BrnA antitoxin family protein [Chloroflexia bacterium]